MLINNINDILKNSINKNQFFTRNLIKEVIQDYILKFVYQNSNFQDLIFTGGTCLRKLYGLDRLSEDLDFDYTFDFNIQKFVSEIKSYFVSELQYVHANYKISVNKQTLFIKIPIENVFVRCDFSQAYSKEYELNKGIITAGQFRFFVNAYDLETMFTNKIIAFLKRNFYKGKFQKIPFKGRDIYDLFWFLQLSAKSGYNLKPNQHRLIEITGSNIKAIKQEIKDKLSQVDPIFVYEDMLPLVESDGLIKDFLIVFKNSIIKHIDLVM